MPYYHHYACACLRFSHLLGYFRVGWKLNGTLLEIVKKRKLRWSGHLVRVKETLGNTMMHGEV